MIFLSAQPGAPYFVWQLEVQLKNFHELGIRREQIHILFAYDEKDGVHFRVKDFMTANAHLAQIFAYPDRRVSKSYLSSVRPHIIKQHFAAFGELECQSVFYHDSDIVFTGKLPAFDELTAGDTWYFSDTRGYMDSDYIRSKSPMAFLDMCAVIGIDPKLVIDNDVNTGGAQTLLKQVTVAFWDKMERDCETMFTMLNRGRKKYLDDFCRRTGKTRAEFIMVPPWCTDMWALYWNALLIADVRTHPSLDFCWPHHHAENWEKYTIYHDAGIDTTTEHNYFFKGTYRHREPYDSYINYVATDKCGSKYVQLIEDTGKLRRYDARDTTFLITLRVDSPDRIQNANAAIKFIKSYFDTNIVVLETGNMPAMRFDDSALANYIFVQDNNERFFRERYNNILAANANTPVIVKFDADVVVPANQLYSAILSLRYGPYKIAYPFDGTFIKVDGILRQAFIDTLDVKLLFRYKAIPKFFTPSYGGCVALDTSEFRKIGMDNEHFNGWGFEDQEIYHRYRILGYTVNRQAGPLFHLEHFRGKNSYFFDNAELLSSYKEFVNVCTMTKNDLYEYVTSWNRNYEGVGQATV